MIVEMCNLLFYISYKFFVVYILFLGFLFFKFFCVVVGIMGVDDNFRRGICGSWCFDSDGVDSSYVYIFFCFFVVDGDGMLDSFGNGFVGGGIFGWRVFDFGGIIVVVGGEEVFGEDVSVCNG